MDQPPPINCPGFIDASQTPPSPISSLRGVFSRSRPTSYAPSECPTIASERPTSPPLASHNPDECSGVPTCTTSAVDDVLCVPINPTTQKTELFVYTEDKMYEGLSTPKVDPASSKVKPSNTTLIARTVHTLFLKKSNTPTNQMHFQPASITSEVEYAEGISPLTSSKSTGRNWRSVRRTVSYILHREPKVSSATTIPSTISSPRALKPSKYASLKAKSSSASIFTQRSRHSAKRLTISPPPRLLAEQQAQALARKKRLRHSRSFSGYPNVLTDIADECSEVDRDLRLDEVTIEAQEVMKDLRRQQEFSRNQGIGKGKGATEIM